jgi:PiT family inorganic phosphate transporter
MRAMAGITLNSTAGKAVKRQHRNDRRRLVRRSHLWGIAAAWVITVPAAGLLAAILYSVLHIVTAG